MRQSTRVRVIKITRDEVTYHDDEDLGSGASSSYYTEDDLSDKEEQLEQSRYENRLANNQVRLNLFMSKDEDNFNSLVSGNEYDSFQDQDGGDTIMRSSGKLLGFKANRKKMNHRSGGHNEYYSGGIFQSNE